MVSLVHNLTTFPVDMSDLTFSSIGGITFIILLIDGIVPSVDYISTDMSTINFTVERGTRSGILHSV
jgi:hypothetical protein